MNNNNKKNKSCKLLWHCKTCRHQRNEAVLHAWLRRYRELWQTCDDGGGVVGVAGKKKVMEWGNLENECKWRGRARTKALNVTLIYIHSSLAASECGADVTNLIKAPWALWGPKHRPEVTWPDSDLRWVILQRREQKVQLLWRRCTSALKLFGRWNSQIVRKVEALTFNNSDVNLCIWQARLFLIWNKNTLRWLFQAGADLVHPRCTTSRRSKQFPAQRWSKRQSSAGTTVCYQHMALSPSSSPNPLH